MLWHWLIRNDVYKYFSDKISLIPKVVRTSSHEDVLAFLAGLLDSDGGVSARQKENVCNISTADAMFAKHVQDVALSVGVVFGRSHDVHGSSLQSSKDMWIMTLTPESDPTRFASLQRHCNKMRPENMTRPELPWSHDRAEHKMTRILGKVEEISCGEEEETYDIQVEKDHWYYAGAVKSHNTVSLLAGTTPGVHPAYAPYYLRAIRMSSNDKLVDVCRRHGCYVEPQRLRDGTEDKDTMVVYFPIKTPKGTLCAKDVSAVRQLELANFFQANWADNSVSVTVYYRKEELPEIKKWLAENYDDRVKSVSFLLHSEHGFDQAPMQEITESAYEEMAAKAKPITHFSREAEHGGILEAAECKGGACPVR